MLLRSIQSLVFIALGLGFAIPAAAQAQAPGASPRTVVDSSKEQPATEADEPDEDEGEEEEGPFEGEFIGSTIFQGATAAVRLRSPLVLETHYFGVDHDEVGMVGLGWTFAAGGFRAVPGIGWSFSREMRPAPVVTLRWTYEARRWLTQGLFVQSLREYVPDRAPEGEEADHEEVVRHASILDGIHASAILGPVELGPVIEHIRYREENEWKGGARVAWRLGRNLKLVSQVVGPDTEVRGGITWEP